MEKRNIQKKRTTLSEFFTVLGILALFFALAVLIINPPRRYFEFKDSERKREVQLILEALLRCRDSLTELPPVIQNMEYDKYYMIGAQKNCSARCDFIDVESACADISEISCGNSLQLVPDYLSWNDKFSGYAISKSSRGEIKIAACRSALEMIEAKEAFYE